MLVYLVYFMKLSVTGMAGHPTLIGAFIFTFQIFCINMHNQVWKELRVNRQRREVVNYDLLTPSETAPLKKQFASP